MMIRTKTAPFLRTEESVGSMMRDMLLALAALLILPTVHYGVSVLKLAAVSVAACMLAEIAGCLVAKREINISELSPMVTGMVIAAMMPPGAPYWLPAAAGAFAVLAARIPFGSTGHTPFNPAAAGLAFATVFWPGEMFRYAQQSPAAALKAGLKPEAVPSEMLWGLTAGPVGTTAALVIAACSLFLFVRRAANWQIPFWFLVSAAVFAALFPRILVPPFTSVKYEMLSGSLLFCAVFMMTDPVTAPRTVSGGALYGLLGGILLMLMRRFGVYEQSAGFTVLLMNAAAPLIDGAVCSLQAERRRGREKEE